MKFKIKRGDSVVVIAGAHIGAKGKVLQILKPKNRVLVEGVNLIKKTQKPTQDNPEPTMVELEAPVHYSNVMLEETYNKRRKSKKSK